MAEVAERLRSLGLQVFIQPEVATLLSLSGAGFPAGQAVEYMVGWEVQRLKFQLAMEDTFAGIAKASRRPTVLLCDRGAGDAAAYHPPEKWPALALAAVGPKANGDAQLAAKMLVDRYDLVLHLVSAAIGAEEHYEKSGNSARRETAEEAIQVDHNIMKAWDQHHARRVIDNSTDFAGKIRRVITAICSHLGVLSPTGFRHRFAIHRSDLHIPEDVKCEEFTVKYTFLPGSTEALNTCVRERLQKGTTRSITYARKEPNGKITERAISSREAKALLREGACPEVPAFTRVRRAFIHADHYFELDDQDNDTQILQVEASSKDQHLTFPDWLSPAIIKEFPSNYDLFRVAKALAAEKAKATAPASSASTSPAAVEVSTLPPSNSAAAK